MEESAREAIIELIYELLREKPKGASEFELLEWLRTRGVPVFADARMDEHLGLFRVHFLLFHLLYKLRERLRKLQRGDLEIHCLRIALLPFQGKPTPTPGRAGDALVPGPPDRLREYYLDLRHLDNTERGEVDAMLNGFWNQFERFRARPAALTAFGLDDQATDAQIRQRYRELVMTHHPDRGGDAERFRAVIEAAGILFPESSPRPVEPA
ncbi:MAG: DNA-J related domain-containing protein [Candidatus Ozemobacteraceae bacterium]